MFKYLVDSYDLIIFDCDGVIMDSNLLKCEAFGKSIEGYPEEIVTAFMDKCKNSFGVSRYIKFKSFFNDVANEPYNEQKYNQFLIKYADICKEIYNIADITPGTKKLLKELNNCNKYLFVASGSDERELRDSFKKRKLYEYFKEIYGSPKTKKECISIILKKHPKLKAVFIGDAISDLNAALHFNMDFIYMSKYSVQSLEQSEICSKESTIEISGLYELLV